jgi:hypothetical protein
MTTLATLTAMLLETPDVFGGAGWAGAGLLGLVLGWLLLVRLPATDKQLRDIITEKDAQLRVALADKDAAMAAQQARFLEANREARSEYMTMLARIVEQNKTQQTELMTWFHREIDELRKQIESIGGK